VGRGYSCWMLNCWCITWPVGFKRLMVQHQVNEFVPQSFQNCSVRIRNFLRKTGNFFSRRKNIRDFQVALKIPYLRDFIRNYAGSEQRSYTVMLMRIFARMDRRKSNTQNTRLSNYVAANMQVKAGRARMVQRLPRAYAASQNENPVHCDKGNIRTTEVTILLYSTKVKQCISYVCCTRPGEQTCTHHICVSL
jgi:hypothetical protein